MSGAAGFQAGLEELLPALIAGRQGGRYYLYGLDLHSNTVPLPVRVQSSTLLQRGYQAHIRQGSSLQGMFGLGFLVVEH